jgi:hypothetical protein
LWTNPTARIECESNVDVQSRSLISPSELSSVDVVRARLEDRYVLEKLLEL